MLTRENQLALLVSRELATANGDWSSTRGPANRSIRSIWLDPETLQTTLHGFARAQQELRRFSAGFPTFDITREQIVAGKRLIKLPRVLGVEPRRLTTATLRARQWFPLEAILNDDEVAAALAGASWSRCPDERAARVASTLTAPD